MLICLQDVMEVLEAFGFQIRYRFSRNLFFTKVQWFSSPESIEAETLYISGREAPGKPGGVVLLLEDETMLLCPAEPEDVFDRISDLAEYFEDWEAKMIGAILGYGAIPEFLRTASEPFECPLFLTNAERTYLEISGGGEEMRQKILLFLEVSESLEVLKKRVDVDITDFCDATPGMENHILSIDLWQGQRKLGTLYAYHYPRSVHDGVLYRIRQIGKFLESLLLLNTDQYTSASCVGSLLKDVFTGQHSDWNHLKAELSAVGWRLNHVFRVLMVKGTQEELLLELKNIIVSRALSCYYYQEETCLVFLFNETLCGDFVEQLKGFARRLGGGIHMGVSLPVSELPGLRQYKRQAQEAMNLAESEGVLLKYAENMAEQAFHVLLSSEKEMEVWIPPDILRIQEHDRACGGQLLDTLVLYLKNGCRYDWTARQMDVHENTVRYRIKKVMEMMELNLFDPKIRESLLLACLILGT